MSNFKQMVSRKYERFRYNLALLGVEQAWTPIFNLTDLLCKSLALQKNLSTYFGHHQF